MIEIEKLFLSALGSINIIKEKIEGNIKKLIEKGELSKAQGKKLLADLNIKTAAEKEKFIKKGKEKLKNFFHEQDLVMKEDFLKLEKRIKKLEEKIEGFYEKLLIYQENAFDEEYEEDYSNEENYKNL
ncbi:MAG: hypothetical protein HYU63_08800 [Armatimonadetes bacterium]|nr:hypothetical protein [Armatimonadota bacterium]